MGKRRDESLTGWTSTSQGIYGPRLSIVPTVVCKFGSGRRRGVRSLLFCLESLRSGTTGLSLITDVVKDGGYRSKSEPFPEGPFPEDTRYRPSTNSKVPSSGNTPGSKRRKRSCVKSTPYVPVLPLPFHCPPVVPEVPSSR